MENRSKHLFACVISWNLFSIFLSLHFCEQVFSKGTMDAFILRSIYPKLSQCLAEFIINPHQQHLGMKPQSINSPCWVLLVVHQCGMVYLWRGSVTAAQFILFLMPFTSPCSLWNLMNYLWMTKSHLLCQTKYVSKASYQSLQQQ